MAAKILGNALKKMAERSMWRGNVDAAHTIENHGLYGMRVNAKMGDVSKNSITGLNGGINLSNSKNAAQKKTGSKNPIIVNSKAAQTKSNLGSSILNSL